MRRLPPWLGTPAEHALPSGRIVDVEPMEETWICVDLGGRLVAVVDLDEDPPLVHLSLQWPRGIRSHLEPPGTRPYLYDATVVFAEGRFVVRDLPQTDHQRTCSDCDVDTTSRLAVAIDVDDLAAFLDVLAGLDRDEGGWWIPAGGALLWRGRVDPEGRALVERLPPDESTWREREFDVAGRVPIGLGPARR